MRHGARSYVADLNEGRVSVCVRERGRGRSIEKVCTGKLYIPYYIGSLLYSQVLSEIV